MQDTVVGVEEGVSVIADSVVKVFTFASEAVDRCLKLTEGWGLTALIKAIKEVHINYSDDMNSLERMFLFGCNLFFLSS